ncbi:MAG: DNA polymerase I, partial [Candidatus Omnitrophica bacterium]|nr:DNA polymerase I [Candidatus Omnitrophota bacterium]
GSLDNIYKNLDKIKSESRRKMLSEQEDSARMSKELAMVDLTVAMEIDIAGMRIKDPNVEKLLSIFKDLEFKNFAKEITSCNSDVHRDACYKTISSLEEFKKIMLEMKKKLEFVLDTETTSEHPMEAKLVGISFCWKEGEAYYVALCSKPCAKGVDLEAVIKELKPILEDEHVKKIGQNIKYDKLVLSNYGIDIKGIAHDTMIASYLLNPSRMSHGLDDIAFEFLDHKMTSIDELLGTGKKRVTMDMVDIEKVSMYSCADSDVTLRLKNIFEKELFKKELESLFRDIELPLVDVLSDMERNGIKIDVNFLKETSSDMDNELLALIKDIYKIAGEEFNINSPKQLSKILFEKLGLPIVKKTKTGISTDVEVLEKLSPLHPLPKELLRYRELSKLKSTYVDALPELINKKTGRLHTSFNQAVTATGRLSSSNPNLQNIPIKTEEGRKIRKAFIGEKGNFIMSADYSQIELRILAHLSKDPDLIAAFENDRDVHSHTASLIFGVNEKEVTSEMRANAKTVNFGIIYGISAFGLGKGLGIDPGGAQQFIDSYFERYPAVRVYMEDKIEEARSTGYVTTLFNRRRYIPEINTGGMRERQQAERIAINTPVQGSAADLIKIAMINIHKSMKEKTIKSLMTLQVHDELVFEVPKNELDIMKELVKEEMEGAVKLLVPVKVSVQYGKNWLEMEG